MTLYWHQHWFSARKPAFNLFICLIIYQCNGGPWDITNENFSVILYATSKLVSALADALIIVQQIFSESRNLVRLRNSRFNFIFWRTKCFRAQIFLPIYQAKSPIWAVFPPICQHARPLCSPSSSFQYHHPKCHHLQMPGFQLHTFYVSSSSFHTNTLPLILSSIPSNYSRFPTRCRLLFSDMVKQFHLKLRNNQDGLANLQGRGSEPERNNSSRKSLYQPIDVLTLL